MLGFLKRDLSLQLVNAKFYLCLILLFAGLAMFSDFSAAFASLYLVILSGTSLMSLFSYDEANHWEAFAAAAPGGRRAMVNARYVLAVGIGAVVFLFQLILGLLDHSGQLETALLYAGVFLLYAAVILPISYRFGGTRSRMVMVVVVGLFAALFALAATSLHIFTDGDPLALLGLLPYLALPLGAAALAASWAVSRRIMGRKEL